MNDREKISIDAALSMLKEGETVHAFCNGGTNVLLGADWDRSDVEKVIREFDGAWMAGSMAKAMKHEIAVETKNGIFFFETKEVVP